MPCRLAADQGPSATNDDGAVTAERLHFDLACLARGSPDNFVAAAPPCWVVAQERKVSVKGAWVGNLALVVDPR